MNTCRKICWADTSAGPLQPRPTRLPIVDPLGVGRSTIPTREPPPPPRLSTTAAVASTQTQHRRRPDHLRWPARTPPPKACTKRKASAAALDEGPEDAVVCATAPAEIASDGAVSCVAAPAPAPMPAPRRIMSQAWIDSILSSEMKPLPFKERQLRDPELAAIFRSHEESRAKHAEYKAWVRRELETKGFVEVDDDYEERCELLQAVHRAVFYGREEEEKEAMAKLAALSRAQPSGGTSGY
ncbi:hypothetical protein ACP70R_008187 [Stipagrostis hirtigluma subsp. patula]